MSFHILRVIPVNLLPDGIFLVFKGAPQGCNGKATANSVKILLASSRAAALSIIPESFYLLGPVKVGRISDLPDIDTYLNNIYRNFT
jgi:hypothetical protein